MGVALVVTYVIESHSKETKVNMYELLFNCKNVFSAYVLVTRLRILIIKVGGGTYTNEDKALVLHVATNSTLHYHH